jgi:ribosomal protein L40E
MDFFEKVGDTITGKSKELAKKAKDVTDIAKLNSQISSEKDKINKNYIEIGRAYYNAHLHEENYNYEGLCGEITVSMDKITELKKDIQTLKGTKCCENCGAELPREAAYCLSCGTKVEEETEPETEEAEEEQEKTQ